MIETVIVPGDPAEWREFENEDYDPEAEQGTDDDTLGALIAERTPENPFGIVVTADPIETVPNALLKRLASSSIPTKVRRADRDEHKVNEKKSKKSKKS